MAELADRVLAWDRVAANRRNTRLLLALLALLLVPFLSEVTIWAYPWVGIPMLLSLDPPLDEVTASPAGMIRIFVIGLTATGMVVLSGGVLVVLAAMRRFGARGVLRSLGALPWPVERYPAVPRSAENLCIGAGVPTPRLRFIDSAVPNALAVGRTPAEASIAVSRGLVELLDERELRGVLAHEVSHVANEDTRLATVVAAIVATLAWPVTAWLRLLRTRWVPVRVLAILVGFGVVQVVLATLGLVAFLLAHGPGTFEFGGIVGDDVTQGTPDGASPYAPLPRWVTIGLYAWTLHAAAGPFYILVLGPAVAFLVRRAVSRQREFLADADAVLLTRDPEGLALALAKIGAAQGTLRSAESIAHLFITPPRAATRWFDHVFPTHPALEDRVDVLARMGTGLDQRAVTDAVEAGHRHHAAIAVEESARAVKARRSEGRGAGWFDAGWLRTPGDADVRAVAGAGTTGERVGASIPVYERPDGWSTVLVQLDADADIRLTGPASGNFLQIALPDGRAGWVARTAPLSALGAGRGSAGPGVGASR